MIPAEQEGQARQAVGMAVEENGRAVLSDAAMLSRFLTDLLPDAPAIAKLLSAAADDGVASMLDEYAGQGLDGATAVRLAASSLAARTMFTQEACSWAATEFAIALGIISAHGGPVTVIADCPGEPVREATTVRPGPACRVIQGFASKIYTVAFSPGGGQLAGGGTDENVWLWNPATGEPVHQLTGHIGTVYSVAFSPSGGLLASGGAGGAVRVWDLTAGGGKPASAIQVRHTGRVFSVTFSPDGTQLASGGVDSTVQLTPVSKSQAVAALRRGRVEAPRAESIATGIPHGGAVRAVAFSPDARLLASGGDDGRVRLWDLAWLYADGHELTWLSHPAAVYCVAFSPDGRWLASGGADGSLRLWRVTHMMQSVRGMAAELDDLDSFNARINGTASAQGGLAEPEYELPADAREVYCLAFSPEGMSLVTGGADGTIRLWDVATGQQQRSLTGHVDAVRSVAFSPDERLLASASSDQTVRCWDLTRTVT